MPLRCSASFASGVIEREGGVEHVSADNMPAATGFIADWISDTI
jgi:hypothetical protein